MPDSIDRDFLVDTIQRSYAITRHIDFFMWLREDIQRFLPHDMLVTAWGDFSLGRLSYDVASSITGVQTQKTIDDDDVQPLINTLYFRWLDYNQQWYELDNLGQATDGDDIGPLTSPMTDCQQMKSVIVHGIHDNRSNNDCLYAFFAREPSTEIDQEALPLLLPHIDAALRRVSNPPQADTETPRKPVMNISERENEILHWVGMGKTNAEIGMILDISHNTVKNHLKKIFEKLSVSSRAQAIAKYRQSDHQDIPTERFHA
jgi:transcriptional regulator EpsA